MILDSFRQDVRVGLRVLFKGKVVLFLAVLVLALALADDHAIHGCQRDRLRGFSFPHPDNSSMLADRSKASDQNNNFWSGSDRDPTQDTEKAAHLREMAGYHQGSTINLTTKTIRSVPILLRH